MSELLRQANVKEVDRPIQGVVTWRNPGNKFFIFQLHYEADPNKRSSSFQEAIQAGLPRAQYLQEYELQWDSFEGMPVYPDFELQANVSQEVLRPETGLVLLRGWDFGLMPACVVCQLQGERLVVFREFIGVNMGIERFADWVLPQLALQFPAWGDQRRDWLDFVDPAGAAKAQSNEVTCVSVLAQKGLAPQYGAISWEERRQSVEKFLLKRTRDGACLVINPGMCPVLLRGFQGGYRYPETMLDADLHKIKPLKDEHSHVQDALQMVTSRIMTMRTRMLASVPNMSYGWMR